MSIQELCQLFDSYLCKLYTKQEIATLWRIIKEDLGIESDLLKLSKTDDSWKNRIEDIVNRIKCGEPIQYITGKEIFYGLEFQVNNAVLIPRSETEELVHWVYNYCTKQRPELVSASILEVGTGSGCIALTLKHLNSQFNIEAIDLSSEALIVAIKNGAQLKLDVLFNEMNFLDKDQWKTKGAFDLLISNPPYIPLREKVLMADNVLDHEPHLALFVDNDALVFYKYIIEFSKLHLSKQGVIFVECNEFNAKEVEILFKEAGFLEVELRKDMQGKDRMIRASTFSIT